MNSLDLLLPVPQIRQVALWATVTQASPLRIQLDGDPGPLPFTPDTLVSGLDVGNRVFVDLTTNNDPERRSRRVVVVGKSGGVLLQEYNPVPLGTMNFGTDMAAPVGRFTKIDARYWVEAIITLGTGFSIGDASVSLPATPSVNNSTQMGGAALVDTSTGDSYAASVRRFGAGMRFEYLAVVGTAIKHQVITGTLPVAFAVGDTLRFGCTFTV